MVGTYEKITIPETQKTYGHYEYYYETRYDDQDGKPYRIRCMRFVKDGVTIIPARTVRKRVHREYVDIPERPVRISTNMKSYRKRAQRVLRRSHKLEHYKGSGFKKVWDVNWEYI